MNLKAIVKGLVEREIAALDKKCEPKDCELCREIQSVETTGHLNWIKRDDDDEKPSPLFDKLRIAVHFGDGNDYEIRLCPQCGQPYYYCFKGRSCQISYSTNDDDEFNPAQEWCFFGTADEVIDRVFDNYDIKNSRFKRVLRGKRSNCAWWVVESGGPVGRDEIKLE